MSRSSNGRKPSSKVRPTPIKPGSALYRMLEIIAREVAEALAAESASSCKSTRKR